MTAASGPAGLLYVEVDCPPELEAELHAWYNLEHVPERLKIPGFLSGQRYAALEGSPRWLATYELVSPAVLESAEYRKWLGGPLQSAWTTRMIAVTRVNRGIFRLERREEAPGGRAGSGLLAARYAGSPEEHAALNGWHDREFASQLLALPGVTRIARYAATQGDEGLAVYELETPWVCQGEAFARLWTAGWDGRRESVSHYRRILYIRIL